MWWNWQTRWTQNPVDSNPCRFKSDHRHQNFQFCRPYYIRLKLYVVGAEIGRRSTAKIRYILHTASACRGCVRLSVLYLG